VRRPVIGLCAAVERARWTVWDDEAVLLPRGYADALQRAGALAVLLAPDPAATNDPGPWLDLLDGLILAGGADVDPARYGQPAGEHTAVLRPERDEMELAVLAAALDRDLPLLAICRGMQLLNVLLGGDLVQHLPDVPGAGAHAAAPGVFARREVTTVPGTGIAALLGASALADCHHHQALGKVAAGLIPAAWAEDGVLEGVEVRGARFGVGVQWHPEAGEDRRLFGALVAAAL
jgi:putative glutamine amidotransferase